jgi:hypothetical protein
MSMTSTIALNAVLFALIVGILVWLLAHPGIAKGRRHEVRLLRLHSLRLHARR